MSRWSPHQLRYLRNHIPIESVIPPATGQRFACPLCNGHDTAVNKTTNLARCFNCKKNFNPIEMVMAVHGMGFADAVTRLLGQCPQRPQTPASHGHSPDNGCKVAFDRTASTPGGPTALGHILPPVLMAISGTQSPPHCCDGCKRLEQALAAAQLRLCRIERLLARLHLTSPD